MKWQPLVFVAVLVAGCSGAVEPGAPNVCTLGATKPCSLGDGGTADVARIQSCVQGATGTAWGACEVLPCDGAELSVACVTASGQAGLAECDGTVAASACGVVDGCHPGDTQVSRSSLQGCDGITETCVLVQGTWGYSGCMTPLVLSFDGEPVEFTPAMGDFDLVGHDLSVATRWVSAATPWLALDRDGNGAIDDGRELFGSMTELGDGTRAANGFAALAALDDDGDGAITPRDRGFSSLVLWSDDNQNRRSDPGELTPLGDAGVTAIALSYRVASRCHGGDCEVERARFVYRDARGAVREGDVIDVHLAAR